MQQNDIKELLKTDSQNLASLVIIYNVLGTFKEEAKYCMIELMNRKNNGDLFDFDSYIQEGIKKYSINMNIVSKEKIKFNLSKEITNIITSSMINKSTK